MLLNPKIQELNQTLNYLEPRKMHKTSLSTRTGHSYRGCQAACGGGEVAMGRLKKALGGHGKVSVLQDSRGVRGIHSALYHLP